MKPSTTAAPPAGATLVRLVANLSKPVRNVLRPAHRRLAGSLPLALRRQYLFLTATQRPGNFKHPRTVGEKVNWRIINDRRPQIVRACDKLQMKAMARECVPDPDRLRIPETWWTGTDVDDIPDELLTRKAILKPNDGSGDVVFLPATREDVREQTVGWLTGEQAERLGEWGYAHAEHVMLVEELIPFDADLPDYKFHVFDGQTQMIEVHTGRFGDHRCSYFDRDWKAFDVERAFLPSAGDLPRPAELEEMLRLADEMGAGWDFIRVDFYLSGGEIWFGEYSPYPHGGLSRYIPRSFGVWLGNFWTLPSLEEVRG